MLALLLASGGIYLRSALTVPTQPASPQRDYEISDTGALDALVRLGELYNHPMGIICGNTKIESRKIAVKVIQASAQEALRAVVAQLPEYKWREDNGVLIVEPAVLPTQTQNVMNIVIPRIFAENIDVDALSSRLWMELQIQVDPESRSRGFFGHSHLQDYYELGKIDLTNARIDRVLSEIVRRRKSAAWILLPPPDSLKGVPRDRLWAIVTYAKPPRPLDQLCCLRLDYFQQ